MFVLRRTRPENSSPSLLIRGIFESKPHSSLYLNDGDTLWSVNVSEEYAADKRPIGNIGWLIHG